MSDRGWSGFGISVSEMMKPEMTEIGISVPMSHINTSTPPAKKPYWWVGGGGGGWDGTFEPEGTN